jgi:hypothetical protein
MSKVSPLFELLNSINHTKQDLIENQIYTDKDYNSFVINKFLSGDIDTIIYANEMNIRPFLPKKMQYDFLRSTIRKRKRFVKWLKPQENNDIEVISRYYNCSLKRARDYYTLLSREQLDIIYDKTEKGGKV